MTFRVLDQNNNFAFAYGDELLQDYSSINWCFKGYNFSVIFDHETDTHIVYKVVRNGYNNEFSVFYTHITIVNALSMSIDDLYYFIMDDFF